MSDWPILEQDAQTLREDVQTLREAIEHGNWPNEPFLGIAKVAEAAVSLARLAAAAGVGSAND